MNKKQWTTQWQWTTQCSLRCVKCLLNVNDLNRGSLFGTPLDNFWIILIHGEVYWPSAIWEKRALPFFNTKLEEWDTAILGYGNHVLQTTKVYIRIFVKKYNPNQILRSFSLNEKVPIKHWDGKSLNSMCHSLWLIGVLIKFRDEKAAAPKNFKIVLFVLMFNRNIFIWR